MLTKQISMDASIVICTYNRADSLSETLKAICSLRTTRDWRWEVIVVDNNSHDHTRQVVEEFSQNIPFLHYEFEEKQGLSNARNRGVEIAQGDIILFTDDDVLPEPDWLETVLTGMDKYHADACGGFIAPIWERQPPVWLTERFHGFLAIRTEHSGDFQIIDARQAPFGANMAIKKSVLKHVGLFDTNRGRKGSILASGEDGEMFERIITAGFKVMFLGQARVHHKVEAFRLTKKYFRNWRFQTSRNLAMSKGVTGKRRIFNIPLYLFPQCLRALWRMITGYVGQPKDEAFYREIVFYHFLGFIQGLYISRRHKLP